MTGLQAASSDNFAERLLLALDGRTGKWLAEKTGISTSTLSDYGRGVLPRSDKAALIAKALKVRAEWLLTGEGPRTEVSSETEREDSDLVEVAEIDLRYGLGGAFVDEDSIESSPRPFPKAWLRTITDSPPSLLFWARGRGNSMAPTIEDGEIILGDRSQTTLRDDDLIWACALGEIGMVKRLRVRPDHVRILSDNPLVPDDTAYGDDNLRIVGRIIAVVKNL